jgi:Ca2+-dependent lipid-binding protein
LTVSIMEARDLKPQSKLGFGGGAPNSYVLVQVESQKSYTEVVKANKDPMWNEIVSFDIETGNEIVRIDVFNKADIGKDELIGSCSFNLQSLHD